MRRNPEKFLTVSASCHRAFNAYPEALLTVGVFKTFDICRHHNLSGWTHQILDVFQICQRPLQDLHHWVSPCFGVWGQSFGNLRDILCLDLGCLEGICLNGSGH